MVRGGLVTNWWARAGWARRWLSVTEVGVDVSDRGGSSCSSAIREAEVLENVADGSGVWVGAMLGSVAADGFEVCGSRGPSI